MATAEDVGRRRIEVTAADGTLAAAELATCPACRCETWVLYWIEGRFAHLQCARCGTSYCLHEGPCQGLREPGT